MVYSTCGHPYHAFLLDQCTVIHSQHTSPCAMSEGKNTPKPGLLRQKDCISTAQPMNRTSDNHVVFCLRLGDPTRLLHDLQCFFQSCYMT